MRQAGYKDTRICTPEAEKVRKIKQTFEEDESEELNDLYGTFGLKRKTSTPLEHRIQNITEPTIPFRSSSAMLRDLALQDIRLNDKEILSSSQQSESWWGGGIAALGRAAKAVIEMSPPSTRDVEDLGIRSPSEVGLGLVKGGEGVRKTRSNCELNSDTIQRVRLVAQEQRPPAPLSHTPTRAPSTWTSKDTPESLVFDPPPPAAFDEDAFGYGPLPGNYEVDDDEQSFGAHSFDAGSLGSSASQSSRSSSEERQEEIEEEDQAVESSLAMFADNSTTGADQIGKRVMEGALEYDEEFDTPPKSFAELPSVEIESEIEPAPAPEPIEKPLKYADRATKLRIAKSTPILNPSPAESSWFGSLRSALVGASTGYQSIPALAPAATSGALWISPVSSAAPTLVTTSTVMCDSASNAAIDLPPVVSQSRNTAGSSLALRLRPSMAKLRAAVGVPAKVSDDDATPTLSPRLDWDQQGESYAGWNWSARKPNRTPASPKATPATPPAKMQPKGSIDYTKSFFYKPTTPPHPAAARPTTERSTTEPQVRARRSIKSLRAALLLPVAAPPVPSLPAQYVQSRAKKPLASPQHSTIQLDPPVLAIQSPGAWEAGLPPRQLVLEGEEWDARDGGLPGDWGKKATRKGGPKKLKKKASKPNAAT